MRERGGSAAAAPETTSHPTPTSHLPPNPHYSYSLSLCSLPLKTPPTASHRTTSQCSIKMSHNDDDVMMPKWPHRIPNGSRVTAQSQHSHSTVTAQSQN